METRAHHILIGLFTLLAAGAMLAVALWLGKAGGDQALRRYDIVFEEPVSGLSRGSKVEFNGIRIGEVSNLRLDPQNPQRVLARVSVEGSAPIRSDTAARLVLAGVTGTSFIRLSSGDDPNSQPLATTGDSVPVIVATPSQISQLLNQGEDAVLNVNELLLQVRAMVSAENAESLRLTLHHVEQASAAVAGEREQIAQAIQALAQASQRANAALDQAAQLLASSQRLIDQQGQPTLLAAQRSLAALEHTLQTVDHLVSDNRGQIDSGLRGLSELGPTLAELRATLTSLRTVSRQLEDRPADFLLGLQPVKEFQP
jgi:phospholipid/cholesterol/gamma-HCH transport system substrate-binding protein